MIDLRSDVLAMPTDEMWAAMRAAETGWAPLGEDRSVNALEALAAEMLGKETAVFVPTCSIANLATVMALAGPGSAVVAETTSHIATTEAAGITRIGGVALRTVVGHGGLPDLATVATALRGPGGPAALACLENTHNRAGGAAISVGLIGDAEIAQTADAVAAVAAAARESSPHMVAG